MRQIRRSLGIDTKAEEKTSIHPDALDHLTRINFHTIVHYNNALYHFCRFLVDHTLRKEVEQTITNSDEESTLKVDCTKKALEAITPYQQQFHEIEGIKINFLESLGIYIKEKASAKSSIDESHKIETNFHIIINNLEEAINQCKKDLKDTEDQLAKIWKKQKDQEKIDSNQKKPTVQRTTITEKIQKSAKLQGTHLPNHLKQYINYLKLSIDIIDNTIGLDTPISKNITKRYQLEKLRNKFLLKKIKIQMKSISFQSENKINKWIGAGLAFLNLGLFELTVIQNNPKKIEKEVIEVRKEWENLKVSNELHTQRARSESHSGKKAATESDSSDEDIEAINERIAKAEKQLKSEEAYKANTEFSPEELKLIMTKFAENKSKTEDTEFKLKQLETQLEGSKSYLENEYNLAWKTNPITDSYPNSKEKVDEYVAGRLANTVPTAIKINSCQKLLLHAVECFNKALEICKKPQSIQDQRNINPKTITTILQQCATQMENAITARENTDTEDQTQEASTLMPEAKKELKILQDNIGIFLEQLNKEEQEILRKENLIAAAYTLKQHTQIYSKFRDLLLHSIRQLLPEINETKPIKDFIQSYQEALLENSINIGIFQDFEIINTLKKEREEDKWETIFINYISQLNQLISPNENSEKQHYQSAILILINSLEAARKNEETSYERNTEMQKLYDTIKNEQYTTAANQGIQTQASDIQATATAHPQHENLSKIKAMTLYSTKLRKPLTIDFIDHAINFYSWHGRFPDQKEKTIEASPTTEENCIRAYAKKHGTAATPYQHVPELIQTCINNQWELKAEELCPLLEFSAQHNRMITTQERQLLREYQTEYPEKNIPHPIIPEFLAANENQKNTTISAANQLDFYIYNSRLMSDQEIKVYLNFQTSYQRTPNLEKLALFCEHFTRENDTNSGLFLAFYCQYDSQPNEQEKTLLLQYKEHYQKPTPLEELRIFIQTTTIGRRLSYSPKMWGAEHTQPDSLQAISNDELYQQSSIVGRDLQQDNIVLYDQYQSIEKLLPYAYQYYIDNHRPLSTEQTKWVIEQFTEKHALPELTEIPSTEKLLESENRASFSK